MGRLCGAMDTRRPQASRTSEFDSVEYKNKKHHSHPHSEAPGTTLVENVHCLKQKIQVKEIIIVACHTSKQ